MFKDKTLFSTYAIGVLVPGNFNYVLKKNEKRLKSSKNVTYVVESVEPASRKNGPKVIYLGT